jgi:hypothetical protein
LERSDVLTRARFSLGLRFPSVPLAAFAVVSALGVGALLRTAWVEDMEYKGDEVWTYQRTQHAGVDEPWPKLGMPTSYEVRHPGGTVWVFIALAKVFGLTTPTELGRACQLANALALVLLVCFAYRCVPPKEREPWLWAGALAAVNPLAVVFHRKIWPPSVVPPFTMVALIAWWHRDRRAGAFLWGLLSVLIGQLHPGALFLALGVAVWTFAFDRKCTRWGYWVAGCAVATLTLVPWLLYALETTGQNPISQRHMGNMLSGRFWINWGTEACGISLHYTLGPDFWDYLKQPVFGGVPSYGVAALHALMVATGLLIGARWLGRARRAGWRATLHDATGRNDRTALAVAAGLFGFGIVFTLTGLPVHRHYMNLTFPLMYLWLALLALGPAREAAAGPPGARARGRTLLAAMWVVQFAVSASFLAYVHANQRPLGGDYGTPYRAQVTQGLPPR